MRAQRGDTLIEVTLALAILASVIASTTALAASAFRLGQNARQRTEAASLMQQASEMLRNQRDSAISQGPAGWGTFLNSQFGLAQPPICDAFVYPDAALLVPPSIGDTWSTTPGSSNAYGGAWPYETVKTSQGTYDIWAEACSLSPAVVEDLRYTVQIRWSASGSTAQQGSLVSELADVSNIQQIELLP